MINTYVSIDLETTGLASRRDKIIEIGAVKVIDGKIADTFQTLLNPGRKLDMNVRELTGITDEQLEGTPGIAEILPGFLLFLEELPLVGHSVLFDYTFLKKAAADQKIPFEKQAVDTLRIARCCLGALEHKNLDVLCAYYGITFNHHRALEDARATSELYQRLSEDFYGKYQEIFRPVSLHASVKRDTPITKPQKERLYRLIELHKLMVDVDVEKLTRSEASRYTDKILSSYGR